MCSAVVLSSPKPPVMRAPKPPACEASRLSPLRCVPTLLAKIMGDFRIKAASSRWAQPAGDGGKKAPKRRHPRAPAGRYPSAVPAGTTVSAVMLLSHKTSSTGKRRAMGTPRKHALLDDAIWCDATVDWSVHSPGSAASQEGSCRAQMRATLCPIS